MANPTLRLPDSYLEDPKLQGILDKIVAWANSLPVGGGGGAPSGPAGGDLGSTYPNPTVLKAQAGFTIGGVAAVITSDARLSDARTPTGTAGGDLSGTYPSPRVTFASQAKWGNLG